MIIAPPKTEVFVFALILGLIRHGALKFALDLIDGLHILILGD